MRYILAILAVVLLFNSHSYAQGLPQNTEQDSKQAAVTSPEITAPQSLEEKLAAKKAAVHAKMLAKKAELGVKNADNGNAPETMIIESEVIVEEQPDNAVNNTPEVSGVTEGEVVAVEGIVENTNEVPAMPEQQPMIVESVSEAVAEVPAVPDNAENIMNGVIPENPTPVVENVPANINEVPAMPEQQPMVVESVSEAVAEVPAVPDNAENIMNGAIPENPASVVENVQENVVEAPVVPEQQPMIIENVNEAVAEVPAIPDNQIAPNQVEQAVDENAHNNENVLDELDELLAQ